MLSARATFSLWAFGLRCGVSSLRSLNPARLRTAARYALCPVDLWRYIEFQAVLDTCPAGARALDVGSPKLLASRLASFVESVHAVDIAYAPLREFRSMACRQTKRSIASVQCDGKSLPYPDNSFDFAYSVSALEHIADDGDTVAIRELARVVEPNGHVLVTVPLVPEYFERWVDRDPYGRQARDSGGRVFFSRYYDWATLHARIVEPSGMKLVSIAAWQERRAGWYAAYCRRTERAASPMAIATKCFDPIWAHSRLEPISEPSSIARHGIAVIHMQAK